MFSLEHVVLLWQMHELIRGEILEQVLNRLVTRTASPVNHYLGRIPSDIAPFKYSFLHHRLICLVFETRV